MPPLPATAESHSFVASPHRTMVWLSVPVLLSLIAEPLTGLADTAFVARLGSGPLAALGVGTVLLSSIFWIFNFLGIGTQTEVARALGAGRAARAREQTGMALTLSAVLGVLLAVGGQAVVEPAAALMGAGENVLSGAATYLRIRLLGAPAILLTTTAFGALRGRQDMRTPLAIAVSLNALNVILDAVLIFGLGPIPALGIAGAAAATVLSQWLGALWALAAVRSAIGLTGRLQVRDAFGLFVVGRDLVLRTSLLTLFILLTTRAATRIGAEAGAAHQAVRQVWMLAALTLDAYAATAQSLVGYFLGAVRHALARRVAFVACVWSVVTGTVLALAMWGGEHWVAQLLVPDAARPLFAGAWFAALVFQPLNAVSFATDGIHWGSGDYRYLRNAMLVATLAGALGLLALDETAPGALSRVWLITGGWITIRAAFGLLRIWPGSAASPFHEQGDERTMPACDAH